MTIQTTNEGFLLQWQDWTESAAHQLAQNADIQLTAQHWTVIHAVREFYQQYHSTPPLRVLVKLLQERYGPTCGTSLYLQQLFPPTAARQIAKIAGLPKPKKCI